MRHIKRLAAPKSWAIMRKDEVYLATPLPGKHTVESGMAASVVFKELIPLAKTTNEVKKMLRTREVLVDQKKIVEYKHAIGLLDVISIPDTKEHFRIVLDGHGRLVARKITDKEASHKPLTIKRKSAVKGKQFQYTLSDGRNLLSKSSDYAVGDTLVLGLPDQKVVEHVKLEKGAKIYLTGGKHISDVGTVEKIEGGDITYKKEKGASTTTRVKYALALGKSTAITLQ